MRKHIRYFLTMSLSLFSHPSDRYDYKALALKPASDTAERMVSAGRSVVIVNVLSGDYLLRFGWPRLSAYGLVSVG